MEEIICLSSWDQLSSLDVIMASCIHFSTSDHFVLYRWQNFQCVCVCCILFGCVLTGSVAQAYLQFTPAKDELSSRSPYLSFPSPGITGLYCHLQYICTTFSLSSPLLMDMGWFHELSIVHDSVVSTVCRCLCDVLTLGKYPSLYVWALWLMGF